MNSAWVGNESEWDLKIYRNKRGQVKNLSLIVLQKG